MTINIPSPVMGILERFEQCGYEAYVVGGCVRDALLGVVAKDWDICTNALPQEILSCFSDKRTIPTGIEHGTITVLWDEMPVEITTFRVDGQYTDGRHPDNVSFTPQLNVDLARRDFTINAMAFHPKCGIVDLYGGVADLQNKTIRCVGDPVVRFQEDGLRILRGLRFASVLGFDIEQTTSLAMHEMSFQLERLACERIYTELSKLICGKYAANILLKYRDILTLVLPYHPSVTRIISDGLGLLPNDTIMRFAALYQNNINAFDALKQLRAPNDICKQVGVLSKIMRQPLPTSLPEARNMVCKYGMDLVKDTLVLKEVYGENTADVHQWLKEIITQKLCCSIKELDVNGNDLLQIGCSKGRFIGDLLGRLLKGVMSDEFPNDRNALLAIAKTWILQEQ